MPPAKKAAGAKKASGRTTPSARSTRAAASDGPKRYPFERYDRLWTVKEPNVLVALDFEAFQAEIATAQDGSSITAEDLQSVVAYVGNFLVVDERDDFLAALYGDEDLGWAALIKLIGDLTNATADPAAALPT